MPTYVKEEDGEWLLLGKEHQPFRGQHVMEHLKEGHDELFPGFSPKGVLAAEAYAAGED